MSAYILILLYECLYFNPIVSALTKRVSITEGDLPISEMIAILWKWSTRIASNRQLLHWPLVLPSGFCGPQSPDIWPVIMNSKIVWIIASAFRNLNKEKRVSGHLFELQTSALPGVCITGDTCFQRYLALKLSVQLDHFLFIKLCVDTSNYSLRYLALS